jgi:hypothetical protein
MDWPRFGFVGFALTAFATGCPADDETGDSTPMPDDDDGGATTTTTGDASTGDAGSGSTTPATSGGSDGSGTAAGTCDGLDAEACMAATGCMPIGASPILNMPEGACLGMREFLECQPEMACGEAITYACGGEGMPLYEFGSTCIPDGWGDCGPPPPIDLMPCPR